MGRRPLRLVGTFSDSRGPPQLGEPGHRCSATLFSALLPAGRLEFEVPGGSDTHTREVLIR
jgi:hypothetical protein